MRAIQFLVAAMLAIGFAHDAAAEIVRSPGGKIIGFRVREASPPDYANARPFPIPRSAAPAAPQADLIGRGADVTFPGRPSFVEGGAGTGERTPERLPVNKALQELEAPPPPELGAADKPYTTSLVRPADQDWHRVAGKIFFVQNGESFVCTGSLLKPGVVVTAAHCVADYGKNTFFRDWEFVPAYQNGDAPYGRWTTQLVLAPNAYLDGTDPCSQRGVVCRNDVAVLVLKPKSGQYPGRQTGWFGWGTNGFGYNRNAQVQLTQLGYPVALNKGEMQIRTDAQGSTDASRVDNTVFGSLQTGGSSGGPNLINFNNSVKRARGTSLGKQGNRNLVIGVTSWVGPDKNKEMGSSLFTDDNVSSLVNDACARFPKACD